MDESYNSGLGSGSVGCSISSETPSHVVPDCPVSQSGFAHQSILEQGTDSGNSSSVGLDGGHEYPSPIPSLICSWIPICSENQKPYIGQVFGSYVAAIDFYAQYARSSGFGFRLGTKKLFGDGTILLQHVLCNRQGYSESKKGVDTLNREGKQQKVCRSSRCGCKSRFYIRYIDGGGYEVYDFEESHTHCFATVAGRQFLRVNRKLTFDQKKLLMDCGHVGIGATRAYRVMKQHAGGYCYIGVTLTDCKNFKRDLKTFIGGSDAQMIVDRLVAKKKSSNYFFEYYAEEDGTLSRLFWADTISRTYCSLFGDVVCFDATYSSNKYKMVFVPFTGVDNHRSSVTFAAGLLTTEDEQSYIWLLSCFKKLMKCDPIVILSDQDKSMKAAISKVFGNSHHRLCMWHIMEKLRAKVGVSFCSENDFVKELKCVVWSEYIEPSDFEVGWNNVLEKYGLQQHIWLSEMYDLRSYWIPAYFRDVEMGALLRTTSRSESENSFFGKFLHNNMTLVEFFMGFETAMDDQRQKRLKHEHENRTSAPLTSTPLPIEVDAGKVFSFNVFKLIQHEIKASVFQCFIENTSCEEKEVKVYKVKDKSYKKHTFQVTCQIPGNKASCSCKKFESTGIMCRHLFHVLNSMDVSRIPDCYILNRWRKEPVMCSENGVSDYDDGVCGAGDEVTGIVSRIMFEFRTYISMHGNDIEKLRTLYDTVTKMKEDYAVQEGIGQSSSNADFFKSTFGIAQPVDVSIKVPTVARNKGCGKRIRSAQEIAIEKSNRKKRMCNTCKTMSHHNSRTCKLRKVTFNNDHIVDEEEQIADESEFSPAAV